MSYVGDSDTKDIQKLERTINRLNDNLLYALAVNDISLINTNLGARNAAHGPETGIDSILPIVHNIVDTVVPTVFDTIKLVSTNVIADLTAQTNLTLKWIQGVLNDGTKLFLEPLAGKNITIQTGGSFTNSTPIVLQDTDKAIAIFSKQTNKFKVIVGGSSSGGSNLWSAITIDVNKDMQNKNLHNLDYIAFNTPAGTGAQIEGGQNVVDHSVQGIVHASLSRGTAAGFQGTGIWEIFGGGASGYLDANPLAAVKLVGTDATPTNNQIVGELAYDAFNASAIRKTLAKLRVGWLDTTNNDEDAEIRLDIINDGVLQNIIYMSSIGATLQTNITGNLVVSGNTILGDASTDTLSLLAKMASDINMDSNNIRLIQNLEFGVSSRFIQDVAATGIRYGVPSGQDHIFTLNLVEILKLGSVGFVVSTVASLAGSSTSIVSANTFIGDATTDRLNITAKINSNVIADVDATRNFGEAATVWLAGYIQQLFFSSNTNEYIKRNTGTNDIEIGIRTTSDVLKLFFGGTSAYDINFANIDFKGSDIWNLVDIYVNSGTTAIFRLKSALGGYGLIRSALKAGAPTTTEIPDRYAAVWKNTSDGTVKLYYNDGGTLKSVTLT